LDRRQPQDSGLTLLDLIRKQQIDIYDIPIAQITAQCEACDSASARRVEAINGNIKTLLRRGRGYKNLRYLLLKAQRMAVTKTKFVVFRKAA